VVLSQPDILPLLPWLISDLLALRLGVDGPAHPWRATESSQTYRMGANGELILWVFERSPMGATSP
jgi:hypothetical protein